MTSGTMENIILDSDTGMVKEGLDITQAAFMEEAYGRLGAGYGTSEIVRVANLDGDLVWV